MPCSTLRATSCSPRATTARRCSRSKSRAAATGSSACAAPARCCSASAWRARSRPAPVLIQVGTGPVASRRHHRRHRRLVLPPRRLDHLPDPAGAALDRHPDLSPRAQAGARGVDHGGRDRPDAAPTVRLPEQAMPTEIVPLVHAVNQALDRLEAGFRAQRDFTGDMAHELRTPLTIMRARVDSLEPGPLRDALRTDLENMTHIVNQVLDIAELESFIVAGDARADLQAVCAEAVAFMAPVAVATVQDHRAERRRAAGLGARPRRGAVPRRAQPDRERHPPYPDRRLDRGRRVRPTASCACSMTGPACPRPSVN